MSIMIPMLANSPCCSYIPCRHCRVSYRSPQVKNVRHGKQTIVVMFTIFLCSFENCYYRTRIYFGIKRRKSSLVVWYISLNYLLRVRGLCMCRLVTAKTTANNSDLLYWTEAYCGRQTKEQSISIWKNDTMAQCRWSFTNSNLTQ